MIRSAARAHFALEGAHAELACESCHRTPAGAAGAIAKLASECSVCHEADDRHQGDLDRDCARCHGQSEWRDVTAR